MDTDLVTFAKTDLEFKTDDLTPAVRFVTALKLTQKIFAKRSAGWSAPSILFALMDDLQGIRSNLSAAQRNAVGDTSYSKQTSREMVVSFVDIYNDDKFILEYLNRKVSNAGLRHNKKIGKGQYKYDEAKDIAKEIFETDLLSNLELSL